MHAMFSWILEILPDFYIKKEAPVANKSVSWSFTNQRGPTKHHWYFDGKKVHWRSSISMGERLTFTCISMYDTVKISITSDEGYFSDVKGLLCIIEKNIKAR